MSTVSVILPVYNGARFVREAIESVQLQVMSDWELIVINDGSTDATQSILDTFTDGRITIVAQTNQGAAAARNVGLSRARGDFVAFLDADDLYLENALLDGVQYFECHEHVSAIFADGYIVDTDRKPLMTFAEIRPGISEGYILEQEVLNPHVVSFPICTMTRRSKIEKHRLRFDTSLSPSEDWDFWIQLARYARFGYLDKKVCMYRVHSANTTGITGTERRTSDLVRLRMKIIESDWFEDLSIPTKRDLLYEVLVGLLMGNNRQQDIVLRSSAFRNIPTTDQARLLRLMASAYILKQQEPEVVVQCLERSLALKPSDPKARALLSLSRAHAPTCRLVLLGWKTMQELWRNLSFLGQPQPKRFPFDG